MRISSAAVIATSFARIYFRNAINAGLPVITLADAPAKIKDGDEVEIDLAAGKLSSPGGEHAFPAFSPEVKAILDAGGLVEYTKQKLAIESGDA